MGSDVACVKVIPSPPARLDKYSGVRVTGDRGQDLPDGNTCHQCRQKNRDFGAACTNQRNFKLCRVKLCKKCLLNRYGEKPEDVAASKDWSCPRCRGICNCSICMKRKGHKPTGVLIKTAMATGYSSVSEMLLKGDGSSNTDKVSACMVVSPGKGCLSMGQSNVKEDAISVRDNDKKSQDANALLSDKRDHHISSKRKNQVAGRTAKRKDSQDVCENHRHENSSGVHKKKLQKVNHLRYGNENEVKNGHNFKETSALDGQKKPEASKKKGSKNEKGLSIVRCAFPVLGVSHKASKKRNDVVEDGGDADANNDSLRERVYFQMPTGKKLTTISGIDVGAEDVGNALQFLEFCFIFGKVLNLRKGQAENVLRDTFHGRFSRHGRFSMVAQFIFQLLSFIEEKQEQQDENFNATLGKDSWFQVAKKILSKSQGSYRAQGLDALETAANFETLNVSLKLKVLNLLCDEVLKTKRTRDWIDKQNRVNGEMIRETRQELVAAKDREKTLKKKLREGITGARQQSACKSEIAEAHAEIIRLKTRMLEFNDTHDAVRVEPIVRGQSGGLYWKPSCLGRSTVVHQDFGGEDSPSSGDQWFILEDGEKETVEKQISLRRME